jgi:hypothetical protein
MVCVRVLKKYEVENVTLNGNTYTIKVYDYGFPVKH